MIPVLTAKKRAPRKSRARPAHTLFHPQIHKKIPMWTSTGNRVLDTAGYSISVLKEMPSGELRGVVRIAGAEVARTPDTSYQRSDMTLRARVLAKAIGLERGDIRAYQSPAPSNSVAPDVMETFLNMTS